MVASTEQSLLLCTRRTRGFGTHIPSPSPTSLPSPFHIAHTATNISPIISGIPSPFNISDLPLDSSRGTPVATFTPFSKDEQLGHECGGNKTLVEIAVGGADEMLTEGTSSKVWSRGSRRACGGKRRW